MDTSNLLIIHTNTVNTDFLFPDKRYNFTPNFSILMISPTNFLSSEESQYSNQSVLEFPYFFWWKRGSGGGEVPSDWFKYWQSKNEFGNF